MTGLREPGIYGSETLDMINDYIREYAAQKGIEVSFFQTNFEGECVEQIHSLPGNFDGCVLNAGAWTHYSYAIRDAISAVKVPVAGSWFGILMGMIRSPPVPGQCPR